MSRTRVLPMCDALRIKQISGACARNAYLHNSYYIYKLFFSRSFRVGQRGKDPRGLQPTPVRRTPRSRGPRRIRAYTVKHQTHILYPYNTCVYNLDPITTDVALLLLVHRSS